MKLKKNHIALSFLLAFLFFPLIAFAGKHEVTVTYKVNGVCRQCKARIEKAAYTRGVRYADWDVDTHLLTIKFDSTKTTAATILENISKSGHDNEMFTATAEDYNKLPSCCRYRSELKKH